jgi:hypothetical protein
MTDWEEITMPYEPAPGASPDLPLPPRVLKAESLPEREPLASVAKPSTQPTPLNLRDSLCLFLGFLRDIRAEAQNLQRSITDIKLKSELTDKHIRTTDAETALQEGRKIFSHTDTQIKRLFKSIRNLMEQHPRLYDWASDEITHVENVWMRVSLNWLDVLQKIPPLEDDKFKRQITKASELLDELILQIGKLTIPIRINQHLEELRIGQTLEFHLEFSDELPKLEDRQKILRHLQSHPEVIDGVVDPESGLIYHASPRKMRWLLSYILIVMFISIGVLLIFLLRTWNILPASQSLGDLMRGYFAIIIGGIAHVGIDALKQARTNKGQSFTALEDWLLWIHVKELSIIVGIVSLWVGFIGLVFSVQNLDWPIAFFVGYSIDSFMDLFLQRFNKTASEAKEAIREQLIQY